MPLNLSGIKENITAARTELPPAAAEQALKPALIQSGIFHVALFVATIIGMPFIAKYPPLMHTPISIEFVTPEELASPSQPIQLPKPKIEKPEPPPPAPEPEPEPEPEAIPEPEAVEPVPEPVPKPKPPEKPKVEEKPEEPTRNFQDLLKDITPREEKEIEAEPLQEEAPISEDIRISFREAESLNAGIGACWYVDGGVRYAENLRPKLRVFVDDTLTVTRITFLEPLRYRADPAYRAMADSASRALRNPRCNQLDLPIEKYKGKYFDFTFDPRDMLGY